VARSSGYSVAVPPPTANTLRRSVELFRAFRVEQTDPRRFYGALAADSVAQVQRWTDLEEVLLLDVGGGPGYFQQAFRSEGARYLSVELEVGELAALGTAGSDSVLGSGLDLPVADAAVDVCFSSNVLEHVSHPWRMGEEMLRVTKPGGLVIVSFTTWFSPWGGHETSPWHYLGGRRARRRYVARHGHEPKNRYGETLFPVTAGAAIRWAKSRIDADLVAIRPRYHPDWATWIVHIPGVRELAVWNLVLVLRKR
jgi:SAM-dependent methyltransferase